MSYWHTNNVQLSLSELSFATVRLYPDTDIASLSLSLLTKMDHNIEARQQIQYGQVNESGHGGRISELIKLNRIEPRQQSDKTLKRVERDALKGTRLFARSNFF